MTKSSPRTKSSDVTKPSEKNRRCPRCGSDRLHQSHRRGLLERLLSAAGAEIRRCHSCRARHSWFGLTAIRLGDSATDRGLSGGVVIGGGFVLCIAFLWWMITRLTEFTN